MEKTLAFTATMEEKSYGIGIAEVGTTGYTSLADRGEFDSWAEAETRADELNESYGISKEQAYKIIASTMTP